MNQRIKYSPNTLNLETIACEKYISRLLQREKSCTPTVKQTTTSITSQRFKEKSVRTPVNQLRGKPNRQQNLPSPKVIQSPTRNVLQYGEESTLLELPLKSSHKQRSKSTVASVVEREPWGQLLKQHRSNDKVSVFSNFDPLRTLHFLAKELQYQLQAVLPEDNTIQQMIVDMQYALKRVPPEVASTIHLQQQIDLLPTKKSSRSLDDEKPEKLKPNIAHKISQTQPSNDEEEYKRIQQIMEESTVKLETSCRQLETLCGQLKTEKETLQKQLQAERDSVVLLKRRIHDLEFENIEILSHKMKKLEQENRKLEEELSELNTKLDNQSAAATNSKSLVEQECAKLKHQLRLCAIEKEKYIAVLSVRDRQITEIRNEMTQLQEVVNDQLMDLHNNAFGCVPTTANLIMTPIALWSSDQNKENLGDEFDGTLSSINTNENPPGCADKSKPYINHRDLPSGDDNSASNILKEIPKNVGHPVKGHKSQHMRIAESPFMTRSESQANIKMFNEPKKSTYSMGSNQQRLSQSNLHGNKQ